MHCIGEYLGAQRTLEGDLCLMIQVDQADLDQLKKLEGQKISLDLTKYREHRSLTANAYFWKLCDLIAKKLGSDKDTIYLMFLRDSGVFEMIDVIVDAVDQLKPLFRLIEEDHRYPAKILGEDGEEEVITMASLKCYRGSHEYNTKEMSDLINRAVREAEDLGIETLTKEELDSLVEGWTER